VTIADTGIGIGTEDGKRAFARFWRSDAARERSRTGFGIGLAVVREIIEQHDGTVALAGNDPGPGTTVTVTLPTSEKKGRQAV
jgi:signal transduction histidine kinase